MSQRKDQMDTVADKLEHVTTVLLKKWAGFSGFYGFKAMEQAEVLALLNSDDWKTTIDDSVENNRVVELYKGEERVRKERFVIDAAGKIHKV